MDKPGFTIVDKRKASAEKDAALVEAAADFDKQAAEAGGCVVDADRIDRMEQLASVDKRKPAAEVAADLFVQDVAATAALDYMMHGDSAPGHDGMPLINAKEDEGSLSLHDLYAKGKGLSAAHIDDITPNTLLLLPLRRPGTSAGGVIEVVDETKGTLGTNCIAYLVAGVGPTAPAADQHPQTWLSVEPGDVVVVRTAMLEPLHPDLEPLSIHRRHVLAKIRVNVG